MTMEILTLILGLIFGFALGVYLMYIKSKSFTAKYLDKLLINSLLKDSLKKVSSKRSIKTKK